MSIQTLGVHHVGLTVPDLAAARDFFVGDLGYRVVGERPDYPAVFVSDDATMITLWQAEDPATATRFDRRRVIGLHHLALRVADHDALSALHERLCSASSVRIEFPPEALGSAGARHMMTRIPGDIRVEFVSPGA